MTERVLVLPRAAVPGGCAFIGLRPLDPAGLAALRAVVVAHGRWMARPRAETDADHKQLVPYVVIRDRDRVFLMDRTDAGGDPRLHRRSTIGVGGHLNPADAGPDPLAAGLRREWGEELDAGWEPTFTVVGLLNDDRNPVGAVHLGVVFEVDAAGRRVRVRERTKLRGRFTAIETLGAGWDRLETWSQLVAADRWGTRSP